MYRIFVFIFLFFSTTINLCFAQENHRNFYQQFPHDTLKIKKIRLNILKTNPLALSISQVPGTGEFRVLYERVELPKMSSVIGLSYIMISPAFYDSLQVSYQPFYRLEINGIRIQVAQKFYLTKWDSPQGIYVAAHASYNWSEWSLRKQNGNTKVASMNVHFINISGLLGFQKLLWKRIAIDVNLGIGWKNNFITEKNNQTITPINIWEGTPVNIPSWLKLTFTNNIGFAF